jgi:hypothetical protein
VSDWIVRPRQAGKNTEYQQALKKERSDMDPDANLAEMRDLSTRILGDTTDTINSDEAIRLAELVQALDGWLSGGGFPPKAWRPRL